MTTKVRTLLTVAVVGAACTMAAAAYGETTASGKPSPPNSRIGRIGSGAFRDLLGIAIAGVATALGLWLGGGRDLTNTGYRLNRAVRGRQAVLPRPCPMVHPGSWDAWAARDRAPD